MNPAERREAERLQPMEVTFVTMRPDFSRTGKIRDISQGGLSFQYLARTDVGGVAKEIDVDMFISDNGYYLPSLPCRLVYDRRQAGVRATPSDLEYRVCGLQFGELSTGQSLQIGEYLQEHTVGKA